MLKARQHGAQLRQLWAGYDVFISYSQADSSGYAKSLREQLDREGVTAFLDAERILLGGHIETEVVRAARASTTLAILVSQNALANPSWNPTRDPSCDHEPAERSQVARAVAALRARSGGGDPA
ncbi:MAG: toll/interleukin-1 receptor domain-containing protein [Polyangiaceae bacterium]